MSSIVRRRQKKLARMNGTYVGTPQPVVQLKGGGYKTLHPTKGWITVSGKRVRIYSEKKNEDACSVSLL